MRYFYILLLSFLSFAMSVRAEFFRTLDMADGLVNFSVHDIYQDNLGRMWFGTPDGISIYNGYSMESHRMYDLIGDYPSNERPVTYFGSADNGMVYFSAAGIFMCYNPELDKFSVLSSVQVDALAYAKDRVYIASKNKIYRWNASTSTTEEVLTLPDGQVMGFICTPSGEWWLAMQTGLFRARSQADIKPVVTGVEMRNVIYASNGNIWAGSFQNGLYRISDNGETVKVFNISNSLNKGFKSNFIRQVIEDENHHIWFGSFYGLFRYDEEEDSFRMYSWQNQKGGLGHSSVYSVFIDRQGTLWAGTYRGGVSYYRDTKDNFTYYAPSNRNDGLSYPVVGNILADKHDNIWICTKGGGLNMLDTTTGKIRQFRSNNFPFYLPHTNLKSIYYDADNDYLYIGSNAGILYIYDIPNNRFIYKSIKDYVVNSMVRHKDNLFFSSKKGLFAHDMKTHKEKLIFNRKMFFGALAIDAHARLWLATDRELLRYDAQTLQPIDSMLLGDIGIRSNIVTLYCSSHNDIYACTHGNGLYKYNERENRFENFPAVGSTALGADCYRIVESPEDKLIVSCSNGLIAIDADGSNMDIIQAWREMPVDAFSYVCGLYVAPDSTIYVGGMNGMMVIDPKKTGKKDDSDIYFSELYIGGRKVEVTDSASILTRTMPFTDKITLRYNENRISVRFAFANPVDRLDDYQCFYRFEKQEDWHRTMGNTISASHVQPGEYVLQLQVVKNGNWDNVKSRQLIVEVLPPWYDTWWARLMWVSIVILVLGIAIYILLRQERLYNSVVREKAEKEHIKSLNEAKLHFFTSVSHEFRTPLTLIVSYLESVLNNFKLPPVAHNKLLKVVKQSELLSTLITELIDFRKYEQNKMQINVAQYSINKFIEKAVADFKDQAVMLGITLDVELCEKDVTLWFDEKEMLRVVYNLLSNAMKYTHQGGHVTVKVTADNEKAYISVGDDGIGMDKEDMDKVFERFYMAGTNYEISSSASSGIGLSLVKYVIDMHGGEINVQSEKGKGSVFTISLLYGNEHLQNRENIEILSGNREVVSQMPASAVISEKMEDIMDMDLMTDGERPVVVLVEDNTDLLQVLKEMFEVQYNVRTADNGLDGIKIIEEVKPDLVVTDVMMPGIDGKELCRRVKNNIEMCHIPVVMLTALNLDVHSEEGFLIGADDYIGKPFNARLLLIRCNNIIRSRCILRRKFEKHADMNVNMLATNRLDKEFLDKIQTAVESNVDKVDFDIDRLANEVGMSRTSFYTKFKKILGQTPNDFIMTFRLNKSVVMMKEHPEYTIAEISDKLGFNTPNYFCKKFKDQFGKTPKQFRTDDKDSL